MMNWMLYKTCYDSVEVTGNDLDFAEMFLEFAWDVVSVVLCWMMHRPWEAVSWHRHIGWCFQRFGWSLETVFSQIQKLEGFSWTRDGGIHDSMNKESGKGPPIEGYHVQNGRS